MDRLFVKMSERLEQKFAGGTVNAKGSKPGQPVQSSEDLEQTLHN